MSRRVERREALVRACEYDRLQIRLACARAALEERTHPRGEERVSSVARTFLRFVPVSELVKIAAHFLSKK